MQATKQKTIKKYILLFGGALILNFGSLYSQCFINSTDCGGYTLDITITPLSIIPATDSCINGYNYNVEFYYSITVTGINSCYDGNIIIQPEIICNSQSNGYNSIIIPAPIVGNVYETITYNGTLTSTSNPFNADSDCSTATPATMNCREIQITAAGPANPTATFPANIAPLPIELLSFSGKCNNENIDLAWSTASETNNDFFTIEHSGDNMTWINIKTIKGAGNSTSIRNYSFTDMQSKEKISYYRLKQTDYDGKYKYFEIISVKNCGKQIPENGLTIYPNPAKEKINLLFNGDKDLVRSIEIFNVMGKRIYYSESFQSFIDLSNIESGIYIVHLNSDKEIITKKLSLSQLQGNEL